jgi:hypothetical protein
MRKGDFGLAWVQCLKVYLVDNFQVSLIFIFSSHLKVRLLLRFSFNENLNNWKIRHMFTTFNDLNF